MAKGSVTVLIVEDHTMVAQGLEAALSGEPDLEVVGVVGTASDAVDVVERTRPCVVLMDYRLPDRDGAEATTEILVAAPETRVVMLTAEGSDDVVGRAIAAGCAGFLHKSQPLAAVLDAVRAAARGDAVLQPDAVQRIFGTKNGNDATAAPVPDLSRRELEILAMLATGCSTEDITGILYLSPHTVRNHIRNLMAKLGAHTRLEAVAIATRFGLVSLHPGR